LEYGLIGDNMDWLMKLVPTIATCLGGPLAGLAVTAVSKALGIDEDKVQDVIDSGKLNADQIASLKQAEIELQRQAQELGLNFEQLAVQDRASARDLQKETKSLIPPVLSILVTIGFFGILAGLMSGKIMTSDALMLMLGSLGTAWTGIIAFYFGSSASSQAKDNMIHNSTPIK
jgi:membrane-bound ClpP family serine protease